MRLRTLVLTSVAALSLSACAQRDDELLPPPPPPPPPVSDTASAPVPLPPPPPPVMETPVVPVVEAGSLQDLVNVAGADRVFFGYDSYELDESARATLTKQAEWLTQNTGVSLTIEGHADERGTREYNLALGERRAAAVRSFFIGAGVAGDRVAILSYGKERPVALGSDEESWAQNRRAVLVIGQ